MAMKEIKTILRAYDQLDLSKQRAALATVVQVAGSSYRRTGARMLIMEDGRWVGGISGGCLEGDTLRKAKRAMLQQRASLVRYDTREDDAHQIGIGLGCNGLIDVLIVPLEVGGTNNPIDILRTCVHNRQTNIVLTVVQSENSRLTAGTTFKYESAEKMELYIENGGLANLILKDIVTVQQHQKSVTKVYAIDAARWMFFIEVLPPVLHLVIYGGNYDIYPLVSLAKSIGWKVTVVANPNKLDKSIFGQADAIVPKKTGTVPFDDYSAAVLMAHDYATDKQHFLNIVPLNVPYIGMLGPLSRSQKLFGEAQKEGLVLDEAAYGRIHAPIGLDTGATSPEEIAVAILAEIRAFFAKRQGGFLKYRRVPIHERVLTVDGMG